MTIIDNSLFEVDVEDFTLELRFALEPPSNVILSPNTTIVDVIDNEGIYSYNIYYYPESMLYYYDSTTWSGDRLLEYFLHCEQG